MEKLLFKMLLQGGGLSESPRKTEYIAKHYQLVIGIGRDEVAVITISEQALAELGSRYDINALDFVGGIK